MGEKFDEKFNENVDKERDVKMNERPNKKLNERPNKKMDENVSDKQEKGTKKKSVHDRFEFRWTTGKKDNYRPTAGGRSYSDPTADAAIGNIMREQRRKKQDERKEKGAGSHD